MNRQKGIIATVWLYVGAALLILAALATLISAWDSYTARLDKAGYDRGVDETTAAWQKRDNKALQDALTAQTAAQVLATAAERKAATAQSVASSNYEKGVIDGKAKLALFLASGVGLRDPGNPGGPGPAGGGQTGKAETAGTASGGNGDGRGA